MTIMKRIIWGLLGLAVLPLSVAQAQTTGQPHPWGLGLQRGVTPIENQVAGFHDLLLVIITLITLFVLGLLIYVMMRFNAKKNPTPSKTTHNTLIEVIWTAVPVAILVIIAVPSFKLLYAQDVIPEAEITMKAIGKQWYWSYEYEHPEKGMFTFDAYMLSDEEAAEADLPRLLATDVAVVIPVDTTIRILVTAGDVLHSFAMPAFGVKTDAVPGRLNETWVRVTEEGTFYGQCSEICGTNHAYMPIMVKVVSKEAYRAWLDEAYDEYASVETPGAPIEVAIAAPAN